jgi:hypothetical protein
MNDQEPFTGARKDFESVRPKFVYDRGRKKVMVFGSAENINYKKM